MRLWLKLTVAGLLLLAAVLGVVYEAASRILSETVIEQLRERGNTLARPLAASLVAPLLQQDRATVQGMLDDMTHEGALKWLRLADAQGAELAWSGPRSAPPSQPPGVPYATADGGLCMDFQVPLQAAGQPLGQLRYAVSAQSLADGLAQLRRRLLAVSALAVSALGLLVVVGSRVVAAPLQRLTAAAERMRTGEYDAPLPPSGRDEVGRLTLSLGALRDAIRERIGQLAQARDAAEAASRAKSMFLANTSHELRTPLNGLLGMARLARQPGLDDARRQRYLDLLVDSGRNLADILNDTLDLAKIEAGKLVLEAQPFDPRALVAETLATYRALADSAGLLLVAEVTDDVPPRLLGDALRVRQILANYLTNALKFTAAGRVLVRLEPAGPDAVRLSVTDTGPGIAPELQPCLFTPFTQVDASATRRHGGTGLGLAICRELAERMGGRVGIGSDGRQGSTFWAELRLPATAAVPAGPPPACVDPDVLKGRRALIVEDNPVNRVLAVAMLESWGLQVAQAFDGEQALAEVARAQAAGQPFDVVLMDLQMPVMDGLAATRALRGEHPPEVMPIIAVTAAALASEREAALDAGMNDFVTKPIDALRLRERIAAHLPPRRA